MDEIFLRFDDSLYTNFCTTLLLSLSYSLYLYQKSTVQNVSSVKLPLKYFKSLKTDERPNKSKE